MKKNNIFPVVDINTLQKLPEYGKYVLVNGIDNEQYGIRRWHVCEMNDLEDGMDFKENGNFYWLTEKGTRIDEVTQWCELPDENYNKEIIENLISDIISDELLIRDVRYSDENQKEIDPESIQIASKRIVKKLFTL